MSAAQLDGLIQTQGEPFGSTSIFAQNRVFKLAAAAGIKVTLDGQGADEILAVYMSFLAARLASMIMSGHWGRGIRLFGALDGKTGMALRAMRFILPQALQDPARRLIGEGLVPSWVNGAWFARHGVEPEAPQKPVSGDILRHELRESLTDRILPSLLRYQDRNSMALSVESRVPFLTTSLVDFLYALPEEYLISDTGETKPVFCAAMRGLVPDAILDRRDKIGFATPQKAWLSEAGTWLDDAAWPTAVHAVFAGDGVERPAVEATAKRLDHVHFLGRVPYDMLPAIAARAVGSFVCTENLQSRASSGLAPLKLFESLACGLPVIAIDQPFQADVVRDAKCGLVIEAGDSHALAGAVVQLTDRPQERHKMAENARAVALEDHSWAARARETQNVLLRVLKHDA